MKRENSLLCAALVCFVLAGCGGDGQGSAGSGGASSASDATTATTSAATTASSSSAGGGEATCDACETVAWLEMGSAPYGIALSDTDVYWTNSGTGEVMRASKTVVDDVTAIATDQGSPWGIRVVGDHVYWVSHSIDGMLGKAPLAGGAPIAITSAPAARDLVVNDTHVYWTREPDDVERSGIDGSGSALLISANALSNTIAIDESGIYWVNLGDGRVNFANLDGGEETALVTDQEHPWGVAIDEAFVYWTNSGDGTVWRASKLDGSGATMIADGQISPQGIALDESNVYWADNDAGTICSAPKSGGDVTTLAAGQSRPIKLAVDDAHVYWTSSTDDTVRRIAK